jgi:predicted transcriptional regulator
MGIEIKVPRAVQIRRLRATGLDAEDIVKLTGFAPSIVREALAVQHAIKK